jgi:carnitine O-palmitoyltransferase 1, liver isoform
MIYFHSHHNLSSFALTYESAMMRFFQEGRTETIRSLSTESVEFVLGMQNPNLSKEEKIKLHRIAVEAHNQYAKEATCGGGIDRHLFALYVVAMGTETECEFLREALKVKLIYFFKVVFNKSFTFFFYI